MYVKQLPSGSWRVIVQVNGKRSSGVAATRAEAKSLGFRLAYESGGDIDPTGMIVADLLDLHLAEHPYRPTTLADYTLVRQRLPGPFLERDILTVRPRVIDALYRQLTTEGWSAFRVHRVHELIGAAFKKAFRNEWTLLIPTIGAALPKIVAREDTTPELAEVHQLLAAAETDFRMFLWLAAVTGARRGELCALRWEDLNVNKKQLKFRRAASFTPASGLVVGELKTGSKGKRDIDLDALTLADLDAHRLLQRTRALTAGVVCPWLFSEDYVKCWRPDLATHRFVALRNSIGLGHVRLHDVRHFTASELVSFTDARTAAAHMGHARTSMTLDRYAASTGGRRKLASDTLQQKLRQVP